MIGLQPPSINPQPPKQSHHSGQVVSTNLARLERQTRQAWGTLILGVVLCLYIFSLDPPFTYAAPFFGLFVLAISINRLKQSQDATILPPIAEGLGLSVDQDKHRFLGLLPSQMFPRRHNVTVRTLFHGTFEDQAMWLADATSSDGEGSSSSDFDGLLLQLDGQRELPDFLMVAVARTKRGWLGIGSTCDTTGFTRLQIIPVADRQYDLMIPSGSSGGIGIAEVTAILADFVPHLPSGVQLYAAQAKSGVLNVALSSKKGLLSGGGMFLSSQAMFAGAAFAQALLGAGLKLVKAISQAGDGPAA